MIGTLTGMGVTVLSTVELPDGYTSLQFSPHGIAFLCDTIIMQRYVAIAGQLQRLLSVVKVRGSAHSKQLRVYDIASNGALVLGEALAGYDGLLTGAATLAP
jgi:circadian clock protein KaiC